MGILPVRNRTTINYRTLNHNNKLYIVQNNELTLFDRPNENMIALNNYFFINTRKNKFDDLGKEIIS